MPLCFITAYGFDVRLLRTLQTVLIGSPPQSLFLNAMPDIVPGLEFHLASFDGADTAFDFSGPGSFCIRVSWSVETRQQLGGQFSACIGSKRSASARTA